MTALLRNGSPNASGTGPQRAGLILRAPMLPGESGGLATGAEPIWPGGKLTLNGAPTIASTPLGRRYKFGDSAYWSQSTWKATSALSALTLTCWATLTSSPMTAYMAACRAVQTSGRLQILISGHASRCVTCQLGANVGATYYDANTGLTLQYDGRPYLLAAALGGTTMTMWVGDAQTGVVSSFQWTGVTAANWTPDFSGAGQALTIGNETTAISARYWPGTIDDLRLHDRDIGKEGVCRLMVERRRVWRRAILPPPLPRPVQSYTLTVDHATLSLSGQSASLLAGRVLAASQASLSMSTQQALLSASRALVVQPAVVACSGQQAELAAGRVLAASPATMVVAGQQAGLAAQRRLVAGHATVAMAGQGVELLASRTLVAAPASMTLSAQAADLLASRVIVAAPAALSLSGQSSSLLVERRLVATPGVLALVGQDAALVVGHTLAVEPAVLAMAGQACTLTYVPADPGGPPVTRAVSAVLRSTASGAAIQPEAVASIVAPSAVGGVGISEAIGATLTSRGAGE